MSKIRVAIVGYGNIGRYTLQAIEAAADMECVGVVRRNGADNKPAELEPYPVVKNISELKDEIEHYESEYQRDQNEIHQLQSNPKAMERIARERYFMKYADEDIFVLNDEENISEQTSDEKVE